MTKNKIFIGTSGYVYDSWRESFYPKAYAKSKWMAYYAEHFNVVEINATFYRSFNDSTFLKWKDQAPANFRYVLKVPRFITHRKFLNNCEESIERFCRSAALLEDKLALVLLQLHPKMPYDLARLEKAIIAFDDPQKLVIEFRDEKWLTTEVYDLLKKYKCIYSATDSPLLPLKVWVTSKKAYIRMHGHKEWFNYNYSKKELIKLHQFILSLLEKGAKEVYIFFNNDWYGYAPNNALLLQELCGEHHP